MVAELKTNNMARTTGRSGFKLKSSPAKGKLQDFFNTIGSQLRSNKKDIGSEMKSKYSGEAQRANEVPRSGESKFQYDVRTRKARNKAAKAAQPPKQSEGAPEGSKIIKTNKGFATTIPLSDDNDAAIAQPSVSFGDAFRAARNAHGGDGGIFEWEGDKFTTDIAPTKKKSPYKKGLGSYAKQTKGNRGYKMKRK